MSDNIINQGNKWNSNENVYNKDKRVNGDAVQFIHQKQIAELLYSEVANSTSREKIKENTENHSQMNQKGGKIYTSLRRLRMEALQPGMQKNT